MSIGANSKRPLSQGLCVQLSTVSMQMQPLSTMDIFRWHRGSQVWFYVTTSPLYYLMAVPQTCTCMPTVDTHVVIGSCPVCCQQGRQQVLCCALFVAQEPRPNRAALLTRAQTLCNMEVGSRSPLRPLHGHQRCANSRQLMCYIQIQCDRDVRPGCLVYLRASANVIATALSNSNNSSQMTCIRQRLEQVNG